MKKWNVFLSAGHQEVLKDTKVLSAALEDDEAIREPLKDADGSREALKMKEKIH